jgi:hypothetical protein
LRLVAAAVAAVLLAGCEVYAVPSPLDCPGIRKGTFDFAGDQVPDPGDCYFAQPDGTIYQVNDPIAFQAIIAFAETGDGAALCVTAPHAALNVGKHTSDVDIDVNYSTVLSVGGCNCPSVDAANAAGCQCAPDSPASNCSCPVVLVQNTKGKLEYAGDICTGFTGTMTNTVTFPPAPPGTPPSPLCDCLKSTATTPSTPATKCSYTYALGATTVGSR